MKQLSPQFNVMYAKVVRPSIPPEQLLRAQPLQMLHTVCSERLLIEEMDYYILFHWIVGMNLDEQVWDATAFNKNCDRLLEAEVANDLVARLAGQPRGEGASDEHFSVDGTPLEVRASGKSFQPKDKKSSPPSDDPGNPTAHSTIRFRPTRGPTHAVIPGSVPWHCLISFILCRNSSAYRHTISSTRGPHSTLLCACRAVLLGHELPSDGQPCPY
jgi:transposase